MAQIEVKVKLDLPVGVELLGYERCGDGHGFEVKFPLPLDCRCEKCGTKQPANYEVQEHRLRGARSGSVGPAELLDLPALLPSLRAMRAPPGTLRPVQTEEGHVHLPFRGIRAAVAHRQQRRRGGRAAGHFRRNRGADRREPVEGRQATSTPSERSSTWGWTN